VLSGWATVLRGRLVVPLSLWGVPGRDLRVFTCLELRAFIAGVAWQEGPRLRRAGEDYPTGDHVSGAGPDAPFGASASAHGPVSVGGVNGASRAGTNTDTRVRAGAGGCAVSGECAGVGSRPQVLHRRSGVHFPAVRGDVGGQCGGELVHTAVEAGYGAAGRGAGALFGQGRGQRSRAREL